MRDYFQRKDRVTELEAIDRLYEKHGYNITLMRYVGAHGYSSFLCNICGFKWDADASSVWRGNGCINCRNLKSGSSQRLTYDFIKEYVESSGCKLISKEYINSKTNINIEFQCGHISSMIWDSFKRGSRCKICNSDAGSESRKAKAKNQLLELLRDKKFEFISFPDGYDNHYSYVDFKCNLGHFNHNKAANVMKSKQCKECELIDRSVRQRGSKANGWNGGITKFGQYIKGELLEWKKESMKNCNYKCVITGKVFDDIHHLHSLNLIIKEALDDIGLTFSFDQQICDLDEPTLLKLVDKIRELHKKYPLGVCLTSRVHIQFHQMYGYGDTSPEQFEEFKNKIKQGEITI